MMRIMNDNDNDDGEMVMNSGWLMEGIFPSTFSPLKDECS